MANFIDPPNVHWIDKEKPGWYEYRVDNTLPHVFQWLDYYDKIAQWIHENVDAPYRHARWVIHPEHALFRFRYERNYLHFLLRWS